MKYLKLYESFNEEDIDYICKKYNISNYTINNGVVDVDGDVDLGYKNLEKIPLKFGKVTGNFYCNVNQLESLEGCPTYVGAYFDCSNNGLTTLKHGPTYVGTGYDCFDNLLKELEGCVDELSDGYFNCCNNNLTNLNDAPIKVDSYFKCNNNNITTLHKFPFEIGGDFYYNDNPIEEVIDLFPSIQEFKDSLDYNYFREGNNINKIRLTQALKEFELNCPENIKGYTWE